MTTSRCFIFVDKYEATTSRHAVKVFLSIRRAVLFKGFTDLFQQPPLIAQKNSPDAIVNSGFPELTGRL